VTIENVNVGGSNTREQPRGAFNICIEEADYSTWKSRLVHVPSSPVTRPYRSPLDHSTLLVGPLLRSDHDEAALDSRLASRPDV